ncbi:MAG: ATP-binding protein [Chitinophagaceae bacterium]
MAGEFLLAFFMFRYLRRSLKNSDLLPAWNKILVGGMVASIAMIVAETVIHRLRPFTPWVAYLFLLYIIYLIYRKEEFRKAQSMVIAVLPFIIVSALSEVVKLIDFKFYYRWDDYFDIASIFSVIWMVVMLIITNKQRKALAKEHEKTLEEEKQNKIMATLKAELEVQVAERTAEITKQKEELQHALDDLKSTQAQLIQAEKMASLGELTAGVAHEIQNPLNFVNNFSEINTELIAEMKQEIEKGNIEEVKIIADDIAANEEKINHHGKRADAIVKGMLQHSRSSSGVKEPTDINELTDEYLRLAYHGLRAKDKSFNATMETDFDVSIGNINVIPQDIGRAILNLITNAFYAVTEKKTQSGDDYEPTVWVSTKKINRKPDGYRVEISVKDNGNGIPQKVMDKIFQPFFTTKPTGQGTGLGLSLSYDIVKAHSGELTVETKEGEGSEFNIQLPVKANN